MAVAFKAVVLAAGLGTRMRSELPKVMHCVRGDTMVAYPIKRALDAGAAEVAVVVGYRSDLVEATVRARFPESNLTFHTQHEMLGTADAVRSAGAAFADYDGAVLILYGDVPNLPANLVQALVEQHAKGASPITMLTAVAEDGAEYGRIVRDSDGRAKAIVEFKDASADQREIREVNIGLYLVDAGFLRSGLAQLGSSNAQGEFYLTDLVAAAYAAGKPCEVIIGPDIEALHGVNSRAELGRANVYAHRLHNDALMRSGVTMEDPNSVWIDAVAEVAHNVHFEPNVMVRGGTIIRNGAYIESFVRLWDTTIDPGERVTAGSDRRPYA